MQLQTAKQSLRTFLDTEIAAMPIARIPLVGALVAMQQGLPQALMDIIMDALKTRDSLAEVSPAAEAVMRLAAFAPLRQQEYAQEEILAQYSLLHALGMVEHLYAATAFLERLTTYIENAQRGQTSPAPTEL